MFAGFSSPDLPIPTLKKLPAIVFLNTALSYTPGEHWCVACFAKDGSCDFFDPYGRSPTVYYLTPGLLDACMKEIRFNKTRVQGDLAKTCGHHGLFFAFKYSRGYSPDTIMNLYHKDQNNRGNDNMVFHFLQHICGSIIATIET
jgi:hypothetical protein